MAAKPWTGKGVVIVDDSANLRAQLQETFSAIGMTVVGTASNGVEGLRLVEAQQPELVSLDLIMPEMDGVECYRKIMAVRPDQRCIVISWLAAEQKIIENLRDVIPSHLFQRKPVTARELEARLTRIYFPERATAPIERQEPGAQELAMDIDIKAS